MTAYKAALAENDPSRAKAEKSFDWLCDRYYKSAHFQSLEEDTRRRKRVVLNEICNMAAGSGKRLGLAPYAGLKRMHVRQFRDTGRKPRIFV